MGVLFSLNLECMRWILNQTTGVLVIMRRIATEYTAVATVTPIDTKGKSDCGHVVGVVSCLIFDRQQGGTAGSGGISLGQKERKKTVGVRAWARLMCSLGLNARIQEGRHTRT